LHHDLEVGNLLRRVYVACPDLALGAGAPQVEKAPVVIKAGVKKEEADELKKKLEAGVQTRVKAARARLSRACPCTPALLSLCCLPFCICAVLVKYTDRAAASSSIHPW